MESNRVNLIRMHEWIRKQRIILAGMNRLLQEGNTWKGYDTNKSSGSKAAKIPSAESAYRPTVQNAESKHTESSQMKEKPKKNEGAGTVYDTSLYTAENLTQEDLHTMVGLYGNRIEDIYELGGGQLWMLEEAKRVRSAFFVQFLTKAVFPLDPAHFRQRADEVCEKYENLRSAFVYDKVSQPYRIVLKDRPPEINYFDLSDLLMEEFDEKLKRLMEADRLRGFDLERDPLLRINVYKSCEPDTYAIIVSQPHINSDGTSIAILFSDLFVGYALDMNGIDKKIESQSYHAYAEYLEGIDKDKELRYWKKELSGADEDQWLPGQQLNELDYESATYFVPFTEDELSLLKNAQKTYKVTQYTILQGIWGIMVSRMKKRNDFVIGAITSGRDAAVADSMRQAGGFINVLPVRVKFEENEPFIDFLKRMQTDFTESMLNSHCSPDQIEAVLGRNNPLFGHILNNHNFARPKNPGFGGDKISGIKILGGDNYDNLSADLCVYFTNIDGKQGCNYSYNANAFSKRIIQLYSEFYKEMLSSLGNMDNESLINSIPSVNTESIIDAEEAIKAGHLKIAGFMKKHPVFNSVKDEDIIALAGRCNRRIYSEDEIIIPKGQFLDSLPVLLSGKAVVYGETSTGWNNPLRVLKKCDILSFTGLFEDMKAKELVTSGANDTEVLSIPVRDMHAFLESHPGVSLALMRLLEEEKNRYLTLWLNAE